MAQTNADSNAPPQEQLEGNTYEIIRNRLTTHANELRERLELLNEARKEVFGSIETVLLATERVTTQHNCIPRDIAAIGNRFLFGYNVHLGLKTETDVSDVFAVYEFRDHSFHPQSLDMLADEQFERDFKEIYRYYKQAVFSRFFRKDNFLYMVFRVGKSLSDIKTLKWHVSPDGFTYLDNRSDHEVRYPPQHEFQWRRTTRDQHRYGDHPHVSIEDRLFVETVGGDLTIKVENNTDSGEGIFAEDVSHADQTLDDAEIYYAIVGNLILLKIRPYQEDAFRYIVFSEKIQQARRLDAIKNACVLLPDDHGLIFSNGYYLQSGECKLFENDLSEMVFDRRVAAPNGEDYLYLFYNRQSGDYVLLSYNLIEQQVATPITCHGTSLFSSGELLCFRGPNEPQKHHALQIWQTPFVGEDYIPPTQSDSYLFKIGNRDIVRAMAECHELLKLIGKDESYANLYVDLAKLAGDLLDSYFWIDSSETFNVNEPLVKIREAATAAIEEFEKVVRVRRNTQRQTRAVTEQTREILTRSHHKRFERIEEFVDSLSEMRRVRGEIISLRELRYADLPEIERLESEVAQRSERIAQQCVQFLLRDDALAPYQQTVDRQTAQIDQLHKVSEARELEAAITEGAGELEMLIEIVSNLKIDDATHRTAIIDHISAIFAKINQARAALKSKTQELFAVEGVAEFTSQLKLINQSVVNYLDICDAPDKCEEFLTKVMVQLEELEGRFAEFDEFVGQLTEKREEIYNAFESRRLSLIETRNRRANSLMEAAQRILNGVRARVENFESVNEINGYFASDLMIEKVRNLVGQLEELEDSVKVDDIQSRLKTIREDAIRQLKDRQELYVDGKNVIKFGKHQFTVNVQALDLTTVLRDESLCYHLTGTNFFAPIENQELRALQPFWKQEVVSENAEVFRAEYLAYQLLQQLQEQGEHALDQWLHSDPQEQLQQIQAFMGPRYHEAYSKGVHDHDARKLLEALVSMERSIGLLRYEASARAFGVLFWKFLLPAEFKAALSAQLAGFRSVTQLFPKASSGEKYIAQLRAGLDQTLRQQPLFAAELADPAARYLFAELTGGPQFAVSRGAANLLDAFQNQLTSAEQRKLFEDSLAAVAENTAAKFLLARDWLEAFAQTSADHSPDYLDEGAVLLLEGPLETDKIVDAHPEQRLAGLVGSHPVIDAGSYALNYNRFLRKLSGYARDVVPRFQRFVALKKSLVEEAREEMQLDTFQPRVLTSFVRNKLIDQVYLPLVGDNLAKQVGVAGEQKRTDRMGLLLLVSPPGYGKTTLMEYIANRLGLIFMKINGPAIGHHVTSLDPAEAPNAGAREEIEKLNLALEMGDNVMIYVDDIQHCNPEFLQKFISLCDAQRKIEGVYQGHTRTYDLRGRKVAVVMAGNPYTESGEKFQIPDMLSNRADIYNLGEIIGDSRDVFELSYLENAITSNPTLNQLASRSHKDVYPLMELARHGDRSAVDFEASYSLEELNEMVAVAEKLLRVRDIVLKVNREYIRSAAQADDYRTEPPFKLQGSYRNMNRIAEKVSPIMNDQELLQLVLTSYENDAQTLTSDTESNLLKVKEMLGVLSETEAARWEEIKQKFRKNLSLRGIGSEDKAALVVAQMSDLNDGLQAIRDAVRAAADQVGGPPEAAGQTLHPLAEEMAGIRSGLQAVCEALSQGGQERALTQLGEQLQALVAAQADRGERGFAPAANDDDPLRKIIVQHKVPQAILDVVESQFHLLQSWLESSPQATQTAIQESLQLCLAEYEALLAELRSAKQRIQTDD